jgi:hypothetical protein
LISKSFIFVKLDKSTEQQVLKLATTIRPKEEKYNLIKRQLAAFVSQTKGQKNSRNKEEKAFISSG